MNTSRITDSNEKLKFYSTYSKFHKSTRPTYSRKQSDRADISYIKAVRRKNLMPGMIGFMRSN